MRQSPPSWLMPITTLHSIFTALLDILMTSGHLTSLPETLPQFSLDVLLEPSFWPFEITRMGGSLVSVNKEFPFEEDSVSGCPLVCIFMLFDI
jgi:hypothetical protein